MMKKLILLLCLIAGITSTTFAQLGKMQFEDAEQAFNSGKYEEAIALLDKAEKSNKGANPPIMHLRILARVEIIKKNAEPDYNHIDKARAEANLFNGSLFIVSRNSSIP